MKRAALLVSAFLSAILAAPAFAEGVPEIFAVSWGKNVFNFETTTGHPEPPQNINRLPNGMSDSWHLAGDYKNPILTPAASALLVVAAAFAGLERAWVSDRRTRKRWVQNLRR